MDGLTNLIEYRSQLEQVQIALQSTPEGPEKDELNALKTSIEELLLLIKDENESNSNISTATSNNTIDNEYALFMSEIRNVDSSTSSKTDSPLDVHNLEGMKCRAPHKHQWGDTVYHNAMVCSVLSKATELQNIDTEVRVLFINPTHQEMLPCPYFLESECKFSDERCKYSHGETIALSSLQKFVEPKFDLLVRGSRVLAKESNNLWYRGVVRRIYDNKCLIQFESNQKDVELELEHVFPLLDETNEIDRSDESGDEGNDDIINMSLMIEPSSQALGDWEKHTKGAGSKMMEKMGYIVGTGLGKHSNGIIEPVSAVILPTGKSLDYCMKLRENAGGDKNLFSVERKLKRLQKRQEMRNQKAYEREENKVDVFQFINKTLATSNIGEKKENQKQMRNETIRNLNIASLQNIEHIRRVERELYKIQESLTRNTDLHSQLHKNLKQKLLTKENELRELKEQSLKISNEQKRRNDKKKMTVF